MTTSGDIAQVDAKLSLIKQGKIPDFKDYLNKTKPKVKDKAEKPKEVKLDVIKQFSESDLEKIRNKFNFKQVDITERNGQYYKIIDFYDYVSESDIEKCLGGVLGESIKVKQKQLVFLMSEG